MANNALKTRIVLNEERAKDLYSSISLVKHFKEESK